MILSLALLFFACSAPPPPAGPPSACDVLVATGGAPATALAAAEAHLAAARSRGDEGEYTLADAALRCHLSLHAGDTTAQALAVHLLVQDHDFVGAERAGRELTAKLPTDWQAWAFLGDARMEQGDNDGAAEAYQRAADLRPGLAVYDRIGWLRWLEGDFAGAVEMAELAVSTGTAADPDSYAWVLTRLGWLHALSGQPTPELDAALALVPGSAPARLAKARVDLVRDPETARAALPELLALSTSIEGWRLYTEAAAFPGDPPPGAAPLGDRRGLADYLAPRDPARALALADEELVLRHDAVTRMTRAWAAFHAQKPGFADEARAALATGCIEPRVLHHGAVILGDVELAKRALAMGAGLLPSERAVLAALVAAP